MLSIYKLPFCCALIFLSNGCQTLRDTKKEFFTATGLTVPDAANELAICWQNRLQQLPDPSKNGATISGLPGQMFLFTADLKPAVPQGELTIMVQDETPRPQGMPPKKAEVWHFTKDKLEKMLAIDERFGRNYVLFVPWPDDWRDVSRVRIKASYQQPDGTKTLYAPESAITLDFVGAGGQAGGGRPAGKDNVNLGIPDANRLLQQAAGQRPATPSPTFTAAPPPQPVQPATYVAPAPATPPAPATGMAMPAGLAP
jgi:hypothetical protein